MNSSLNRSDRTFAAVGGGDTVTTKPRRSNPSICSRILSDSGIGNPANTLTDEEQRGAYVYLPASNYERGSRYSNSRAVNG